MLLLCGKAELAGPAADIFFHKRCERLWKMSENSEPRGRGDVCILSDRASKQE